MYKQCTGSLSRFQLFQSRLTKWLIVDREYFRANMLIFSQTMKHSLDRDNCKYIFSKCKVWWCVPTVWRCVLCRLELSPVANQRYDWFPVDDDLRTTIRSQDDDPVGKLAIRFLSCPWMKRGTTFLSLVLQDPTESLFGRSRCFETGSSSWDHRQPGINRNGGWQLDLTQAYTIHTITLLTHTITLYTLEKMYLQLSLSKECFIVWLKMGVFAWKYSPSTINHFVSLLWKSWKRGREPVHCLYIQQFQEVLQPPVGPKTFSWIQIQQAVMISKLLIARHSPFPA